MRNFKKKSDLYSPLIKILWSFVIRKRHGEEWKEGHKQEYFPLKGLLWEFERNNSSIRLSTMLHYMWHSKGLFEDVRNGVREEVCYADAPALSNLITQDKESYKETFCLIDYKQGEWFTNLHAKNSALQKKMQSPS